MYVLNVDLLSAKARPATTPNTARNSEVFIVYLQRERMNTRFTKMLLK
jgi:hypothetical protein